MDLIDGLRAFVASAEAGSFTGGAERLRLSNRLVSKYVAELEARLGVRLFQRTTRRIGLTPEGAELLARAPALLDDLDAMIAGITGPTRGLSGVLRLSAPVTFGEIWVAPMLERFAAPHPDLTIDLRLDDAHVDLASEGIDLAFRIGQPRVSSLKVQRLAMIDIVLVAAPAYLEAHGAPATPADLAEHRVIVDTNRARARSWVFDGPAGEETVDVRGRYQVNSARVSRGLALAGAGIALIPGFVIRADLAEGRLVPLLAQYGLRRIPLSAVYLEGRTLPMRVRRLIDFARAAAAEGQGL